jgi:Rrf2 family nitric oxide-sensitive transcriptional repressor
MRLTTFSDFALRTMMYLALHPDRLVTINEVADAYGISTNHLMKVVQTLAAAELIATLRGKHGGLRLAEPAEAIALGRIIRATETDIVMAPCFEAGGHCVIRPACRLVGVLDKALSAFMAVLDSVTLADLVADPDGLRALMPSDQLGRSAGNGR